MEIDNITAKDMNLVNDKDRALRTKTSLRMYYEAQVAVIQKQIGNLEEVRLKLGLTQRKIAQMLLVDPSTWTRWVKNGDNVPPHIWRSLQWYMALNDKIPGISPHYFIPLIKDSVIKEDSNQNSQTSELNSQALKSISKSLEIISAEREELEQRLVQIKKELLFFKKLSIVFFLTLGLGLTASIFLDWL